MGPHVSDAAAKRQLTNEDYHYDPDEGLELRPEFAEELEQRIPDHEAGEAEMIPFEEAAKEFGVKLIGG